MALIKSKEEIVILREGGKRLAGILAFIVDAVKSGVHTDELDRLAEQLIRKGGDEPAFLNYTPTGASRPYPATLCVSVNDEIVHGIPNEHPKVLHEGDIVGLDIGLVHKNLVTDMAVTVPIGNVDADALKLLEVTKGALYAGIAASRGGRHIGDISQAIESFVGGRYGIVHELGGHGVGHAVHEDPHVPNFGTVGTGVELVPGMVLALEPMFNEGGGDVVLADDGYTFKTADGKRSAHFEHTIVITGGAPEILTK